MAAMLSAQPRSSLPEKPVEVWLGGDVNLGDGGRGQLNDIAGIVQGAAGIVNLEGPAGNRPTGTSRKLHLWNSPDALGELRGLNVKVAGIANNHSGDAGDSGPLRSAEILRTSGILPTGGPAGPATLEIGGIKIVVTAHDLTRGVPPALAADLQKARSTADFLIATFHVTGPASYLPRPELRRAVEIAYNAGATVIAAHGTHAVGPVERREHAVIAWGLGNVAFACDCTQEREAILLRVKLTKSGVAGAEVVPIDAGLNGARATAAADPKSIFDLLEAIGSSKLQRHGPSASF